MNNTVEQIPILVDKLMDVRKQLANVNQSVFEFEQVLAKMNQMVDKEDKQKEKEVDKDIIAKLADDVFVLAKTNRGSIIGEKLISITQCLYDIRSDRSTQWYKDMK
jgi:hypothetical protein